MSWARLDDGFADHPKVLALSDAAFRLHVCAMAWSARRATDGLIVRRDIRVLVGMLNDFHGDPMSLVAELVDAKSPGKGIGLWEPICQDWKIHDWDDYNPSADEVAADRAAAKERMKRAREAKRARSSIRSGEQGGERSPDVRSSRPDPTRPDPSPPEPNGSVKTPKPPKGAEQVGLPGLPAQQDKRPTKRTAEAENKHVALILLAELSEARLRVDNGWQPLKARPGNLCEIEGRLNDGYTAEEIRHVIRMAELNSRVNPLTKHHFDAVTPFRKSKIGRWIAMSEEQARRAPEARSPGMLGTSEAIDKARSDDEYYKSEAYQRQLKEELNGDG